MLVPFPLNNACYGMVRCNARLRSDLQGSVSLDLLVPLNNKSTCLFPPFARIMSLKQSFPAYGGRGPSDMRVGIAMGVITTIIMVLRVYVRLRINKFGTAALIWTLVSWVCWTLFPGISITLTLFIIGIHSPDPGLWDPGYSPWPRKPHEHHCAYR